ncbi:MAG: hypothetical protein EBE86_035140 [Hormoscilla sp. GUM202]|nr:hypothetical protein [Hormoscilla sp. GUM202]
MVWSCWEATSLFANSISASETQPTGIRDDGRLFPKREWQAIALYAML